MDHVKPNSRSSSSESHDANSTTSQAASSTYPILNDRTRLMPPNTNTSGAGASPVSTGISLERPVAPFMSRNGSYTNLSSGQTSPTRLQSPNSDHKLMSEGSSVSLSVNYLPTKFSSTMLNPGARRRKGGKKGAVGGEPHLPKMGGGVEAFKSGEARMPEEGDDDYDGVNLKSGSWFAAAQAGARKMRWNRFKWTLFVSNIVLTVYALTALIVCLLVWFDVWSKSDIIRVGNRTELVISTLAAAMGVFTSLIGWAGILLNNRSFLAIYTLLLWITFIFLVLPGYLTYKRHTFNLEGKINAQWSRDLGAEGRLRIQNQLKCCGYFSPFVEATVSQTCYSRSILPGCKSHYLRFERMVLSRWYTVVFSLVPVHVATMVVALLCSNHVTYRFGKGMMPKAYRLSMNSMAVIMDNYASQLAEQYGNDVASDVLARSRSNLQLDALPTVGYSQNKTPSLQTSTKYDSVATRGSE